jgi:hypothetical protein
MRPKGADRVEIMRCMPREVLSEMADSTSRHARSKHNLTARYERGFADYP